jgi:hypothetical protein
MLIKLMFRQLLFTSSIEYSIMGSSGYDLKRIGKKVKSRYKLVVRLVMNKLSHTRKNGSDWIRDEYKSML